MTLAIIIARESDIIVIADTRQEGNHPDYPNDPKKAIYHDQAQKVFVSAKHRIGLCISGNATLVNSAHTQLDLSYVMRSYFSDIDKNKSSLNIENLLDDIVSYVKKEFPAHFDHFSSLLNSSDPNNSINLFYGGFNKKENCTEIHSQNKGNHEVFQYKKDNLEKQLCAFCNCSVNGTQSLLDYMTEDFLKNQKSMLPPDGKFDSPFLKKNQNELICYKQFDGVLKIIVPSYRKMLHEDIKRETYIGQIFDCFKINNPRVSMSLNRYVFTTDGKVGNLNLEKNGSIDYTLAKNDFEAERQAGRLRYRDQDHNKLKLSSDPPSYKPS